MSEKHNLHCTCPNCSKTGMTMTEQAAFCNGNGQRLIGAPDNPAHKVWIRRISAFVELEAAIRQDRFGHYPN